MSFSLIILFIFTRGQRLNTLLFGVFAWCHRGYVIPSWCVGEADCCLGSWQTKQGITMALSRGDRWIQWWTIWEPILQAGRLLPSLWPGTWTTRPHTSTPTTRARKPAESLPGCFLTVLNEGFFVEVRSSTKIIFPGNLTESLKMSHPKRKGLSFNHPFLQGLC